MLDQIRSLPGKRLDVTSYHALLRAETERATGVIWKLERSQYFHEPDDDPAWQAFRAGDWARVLGVFESERPDARAEAEMYAREGGELRRIRIVENPASPYLIWEAQWFKVISEEGTSIRVLDAEQVRDLEDGNPLPEVVIDEHALYHVRYDEDWKADGAKRVDDPGVLRQARDELADLWEQGEDFLAYFSREIIPLMPAIS